MPFIGKQPEVGAYQLIDSITTSATATYALTVDGSAYFPASARNLIVSLNGVTQAPESAYTVSGSNIVFDSALTASDVIDYIMVIGDAVDIGTPSDGTVGTSQMSYPLGNFSSTGIDDNATSTAITIDSSQNVGVGTTDTNGGKLVVGNAVSGDTSFIQLLRTGVTERTNYIGLSDSDAIVISADENNEGGDSDIRFKVDGSERMRIDANGHVGIGEPSDGELLSVAAQTYSEGADVFAVSGRPSSATGLYISTFTANSIAAAGIDYNAGSIAGEHSFSVNGSEKVRIDSNGNLQVTGTLGNATLESNGAVLEFSRNGANYIGARGGSSSFFIFQTGGATERMRLDSSGNLLVGKTVVTGSTAGVSILGSSSTLGVSSLNVSTLNSSNSTSNHLVNFRIGGTASTSGTASGAIAANGASQAAFVAYSDERLKENIEDLPSQIESIKSLRPCEFDYKDGSGHQIGFIAQEMQQVYSDCVGEDDDGFLTIGGWNKTEARLVKAIQEQQTIIEDLQTRLSALEAN